jgi:plasmid stabilization system protein ParE
MKVFFSAIAKQELDDAADYLEREFDGLGTSFKAEVELAADRISRHPLAWSIESGEIRKCLLHRFPYKLLYSIETDHLLIIAVAHQHREPDYWIDRQ